MKKITVIIAIALFFYSCNNTTIEKTDKTKATQQESTTNKSVIETTGGTQIKVLLTGGANAGSYTASSAESTCSMGLTGKKSFGNQYSVSGKADNEFSSLQLLVDDYEAAKSGTDKFYISVAFGKILMGNKYEINGSDNSISGKKQGSGKLTIIEIGGSKVVHVAGKTSDGINISVDISCNTVLTDENGQVKEK